MTILIVSAKDLFSEYGGGQVYLRNLIDELVRRKIYPDIASPAGGTDQIEYYKGCKIIRFSPDPDLNKALQIIHLIKPDVIHLHGYKSVFSEACRHLKIPCVITVHHGGILCPAGSLLNYRDEICMVKASYKDCLPCVLKTIRGGYYIWPFIRIIPLRLRLALGELIEKLPFILFFTPVLKTSNVIRLKFDEWDRICNNATLVIAPSKGIAEIMIRNGLKKEKLIVLPHGIPLPQTQIKAKSINNPKDFKPVKFFYVGRICHVKGIHILLAAFRRVKDNAELHLIGGAGNHAEERYMNRLKRKYKNDKRIFWDGKVDYSQINAFIQQFDVMVHPAICLEVFGLNIAEALASGKPVIASRCGGPEMQIADGKNGWLIEPNDIRSLSNKLKEVTESGPELNDVSAKVLTIKDHVGQLMKIYEKITH